jgi:hypothetical protein
MFGKIEEQSCFYGKHDAILGLAYPDLAKKGYVPFFDQLMN